MNAALAEKALIARIVVDPENMLLIDGLSPDDFGIPDMATIFGACQRRHKEGEGIDATLIGEECGIEIDVLELSPASFAPIEQYVLAIKDAAVRRRMVSIIDAARGSILSGAGDPVGTITAAIERVSRIKGITGVRSAGEVVRSYRDEFHRRSTVGDGITFGVEGIDAVLLPMRAGRLVVFASRPGIGKTALAESVSDHAALSGPVLFVSLEMRAEELTDRAMARMSGETAKSIMRGTIDIGLLDKHLKTRSDMPITYVDDGSTTTSDILSAAQQVKMRNDGKLALIIVDYMQLVADKDKGDNEVYRVGAISHALKRLSLKLRVPVLALAQLNRASESERRLPRLSDLRDSGAIEQDADVVMIMQGDPTKHERVLHILKQRQGSLGRIKLNFDGDTQRWTSEVKMAW